MRYKITIVTTDVYDCEVEANSLSEAKEIALGADNWVIDAGASGTELGYDHEVWDETTNTWEEVK